VSIEGPGLFDNDDAADWLGDLNEEPSLALIEEALAEAADPLHAAELEVSDCCTAVAAAEILTQLLGRPGSASRILDEEVYATLTEEMQLERPETIKDWLEQAIRAVDRVVHDEDNSELRHIWEEDPPGMGVWITAMHDLEKRLRALRANLG
jgi:hypothetical protein